MTNYDDLPDAPDQATRTAMCAAIRLELPDNVVTRGFCLAIEKGWAIRMGRGLQLTKEGYHNQHRRILDA